MVKLPRNRSTEEARAGPVHEGLAFHLCAVATCAVAAIASRSVKRQRCEQGWREWVAVLMPASKAEQVSLLKQVTVLRNACSFFSYLSVLLPARSLHVHIPCIQFRTPMWRRCVRQGIEAITLCTTNFATLDFHFVHMKFWVHFVIRHVWWYCMRTHGVGVGVGVCCCCCCFGEAGLKSNAADPCIRQCVWCALAQV